MARDQASAAEAPAYDDAVKQTASVRAAAEQSQTYADPPPASRSVLIAVLVGAALFAAAAVIPRVTGTDVRAGWTGWPPLAAAWMPRVGPGTLPALAFAAAVVLFGPGLCARLAWRPLVVLTWGCTLAWTTSLALVDGRSGIAEVFARDSEYVYDATRVSSVGDMLSGFISRIPITEPDRWQSHVAGHPAGALLTFVGLDRVGINDPFVVGLVILTAGSTATVAALVAVRALAGEDWARRAAPFWAAAPAAVWLGVSADALYTAVASWGLACLALAATRPHRRVPYALLAGVLLGYCCYLSYGLVLLGILAVAVLVAARSAAPLPWAIAGALAVAAAFTAAGFVWWQALPVLVERYYDGIGGARQYWYWVWGNLGAATAAAGLAVWAGLPLATKLLRRELRRPPEEAAQPQPLAGASQAGESPAGESPAGARAVALLGSAAVLSMLVSTVSGMSKAEVERIWLPFTWWALLLPALLPDHQRRWLVALQVGTGLLIASMLKPGW